jgi:hypothetical protein
VLESYRIKRKRGHDGHQQTDLCTAATLALATKGKGPSSSRRVQRKTRATRPELEYSFTTRCNYYQMVEVANVCNGSSEAIRLKENFWMCSQRRSQHLNSRGTNKRGNMRFATGLGSRYAFEGLNLPFSSIASDDVEKQERKFWSDTRQRFFVRVIRFGPEKEIDHVEIRLVKATPIDNAERREGWKWDKCTTSAGVLISVEWTDRGIEDNVSALCRG